MIRGEDIRDKRKSEGMSAEDLAMKLGLNKENLYKWERGTKISDPVAYNKLESWLKSVENVPQGHFKPHGEGQTDDARISGLIESNRMMAAAMLADAENRQRLTRSNEELTQLVKQSVGDQSKTLEVFESRLQAFLAALSLVASGKRYKSEVEASAALSKLVYDGHTNK